MARTTRLLFLALLLLEVCPVICPCSFCNRAFYRYSEGFGKFCHSTRLCIVLGSRIFVAWLYVRCIVSVSTEEAQVLCKVGCRAVELGATSTFSGERVMLSGGL